MTPPAKSVEVSRYAEIGYSFSRIGHYLAPIILAVVDYFVIVFSAETVVYFRAVLLPRYVDLSSDFSITATYIFFILPATYLLLMTYEGMYVKRMPFWKSVESLFKICSYASVLMIVMLYFTYTSATISRLFVGMTWIVSFIYLIVARYITKRMLLRCGLWEKPVVIVGAGKTAEILAKNFASDSGLGYKIVGIIEDNYKERPLIRQYQHIGTFADIETAIVNSRVQDVMIATPGLDREKLLDLVYRVQPYVRDLTIVPDLFGVPMSNMEVETLYNEKTLILRMRNNMMLLRNRILKRTFDFLGSVVGACLISPILVGIAVAIYIGSPGPVIFAHMRIGANGKLFPCYKFRSMVTNSQEVLQEYLVQNPAAREEWERDFKLKDDPRVTKIGAFLRKTSLDELPQIFNVIKGEMSLVGPRPIIDKEIQKYKEYIHDYYLVRPGMTGFWQVSGRSDVDYDQRVQMDSWYVRNWSFWQDIVILVKTVNVVLKREGAY